MEERYSASVAHRELLRPAGRAVGGALSLSRLPDHDLPGVVRPWRRREIRLCRQNPRHAARARVSACDGVAPLLVQSRLGTLAYRWTCCGAPRAVAVALVYFAGRVLGLRAASRPRRLARARVRPSFWSKALCAKGYALNAALVAAGFLSYSRGGYRGSGGISSRPSPSFALEPRQSPIVIALVRRCSFRRRHRPRTALLARHDSVHRRDGRRRAVAYFSFDPDTSAAVPRGPAPPRFPRALDVMLAQRWAP